MAKLNLLDIIHSLSSELGSHIISKTNKPKHNFLPSNDRTHAFDTKNYLLLFFLENREELNC
jgi:hypothetical protein